MNGLNKFLFFDNAVSYARERATATGWYYSIIVRCNVHLRDYEYEVIPHIWPEAIFTAIPNQPHD